MMHPIIIIGAGLAGYQVARELRKQNRTLPLTMVTADAGLYYSKPQLSTALTSGKTADSLATATAETMAAQLNAEIRTHTTVHSIHTHEKCIRVDNDTLPYSQLILACGADVMKPPLKGDGIENVLSINHLYHYTEFRGLIQNKKSIAILGAGLIGCEFANDLSNANYQVHVIAPVKTPLDGLLPSSIGHLLQLALEKNGVHFHLPATLDYLQKTTSGYSLTLSNGEQLPADLVLSAIGLKPHVRLAEQAGILINHGILVNRYLETSANDVYALGDCAEVEGHVLPYLTPLLNCSRALAKSLCGIKTAVDYPAMPIVIKTPAHPIAVCPPPRQSDGAWQIETTEKGLRALFYNANRQLLGFVLTHDATQDRTALAKTIPPLF